MVGSDEWLRTLVLGALLLAVVVGLVGGLLTQISGQWQDGERRIQLRQVGPFVRGTAAAGERYAGLALFGHAWLKRSCDEAHLDAQGFTAQQAPLLRGHPLATFRFRVADGGMSLSGTFEGRHFTFRGEPPTSVSVARLPGSPRQWQRVG